MTRNGYFPGRLRPGFFYAVLRCESGGKNDVVLALTPFLSVC